MNISYKILLISACIMSVPFAVNAADVVTDYENSAIVISGNAETGKKLSIMIIDSSKSPADLPAEGQTDNFVEYADVVSVGEDGSYKFDFEVDPVSRDYNYYINSNGTETITGKIHFVSADDMKAAIEALNAASADNIAAVLETNKYKLGIDIDLYEQLNKSKAAAMLYSYVSGNSLDSVKLNESKTLINGIIGAEAAAEGKLASLADNTDLYQLLDSRAVKWCKSEIMSDSMEKSLLTACSGTYSSVADFNKVFCEKLVMEIIKNPGGWSNVKAVISDFAAEIGVNAASISASTYTRLAGTGYSGYGALKAAITSAEKTVSSGGGGGGSSSGGSSSSSGSGGGTGFVGFPSSAAVEQPVEIKTFDDLNNVEWAREAILRLYNNGIVSGREEGRFYPSDSVTREEFVKMLVGAAGIAKTEYSDIFDDVNRDDWFAPYVISAVKSGICEGIGDNLFGSGLNISRQDMACMIYNLIKDKDISYSSTEDSFDDEAEIADYAVNSVTMLQSAGIINGRENNMFVPNDDVTRAEAAVVINSILPYFK